MATSSSLAVVAAVVAVDAVAVADAVAVVVADAVAASVSVAAAHPGVRAAGANRGYLPRVIDTNNHGRDRHRRPGLCMCTSGVVRNALLAHRDHAEFPPH